MMLTATWTQAFTYLLGVTLFSISFLVFLNSSISFVITDIIKQQKGIGDAVGTLGFADELVALVFCPVWGLLSDRIGVRIVSVTCYTIVGLSLFLFVQAQNVYPQLLLARMFFSVGGAGTATMVTAILPAMTMATRTQRSGPQPSSSNHTVRSSVSSELTITPERLEARTGSPNLDTESAVSVPSTRLAGYVGAFAGLGALLALIVFLPLPTRFKEIDLSAAQALTYTYYVVGGVAFLVSGFCFLGLRNLNGEETKSLQALWNQPNSGGDVVLGLTRAPYWSLFLRSIKAGAKNPLIGLGYLGGFVARASSVGISLFIPLFINDYFIISGICQVDDPAFIKSQCHEAYILSSKLTGTSQLVALIFAPIFGYLADKYRLYDIPLLAAALSGILGYTGFSLVKSPDPSREGGSYMIYAIVSLIGISQIGCIVCSLGLLARGISGIEDRQRQHHHQVRDLNDSTNAEPQQSEVGEDESAQLLEHRNVDSKKHHDLQDLKGSIAGTYSLGGGAGILLLTKLGGYLFDNQTKAAPFIMLLAFNILLVIGTLLIGSLRFLIDRRPRK